MYSLMSTLSTLTKLSANVENNLHNFSYFSTCFCDISLKFEELEIFKVSFTLAQFIVQSLARMPNTESKAVLALIPWAL
jgi:hypothetical protein